MIIGLAANFWICHCWMSVFFPSFYFLSGSESCGLWLGRGSLPPLGTRLLMDWIDSVLSGNCFPSLGLKFWLYMYVASDLAGGSVVFSCWPGFCWDRRLLPGFLGSWPGIWGSRCWSELWRSRLWPGL